MKINWRSLFFFTLVAAIVVGLFNYNDPALNFVPDDPLVEPDTYLLGTVSQITDEGSQEIQEQTYSYQNVIVKLEDAEESQVHITHNIEPGAEDSQTAHIGDKFVIAKVAGGDTDQYYITDRYRLPAIGFIFVIFFVITILLAKFKGFTSILGLFFSVVVLAKLVVPLIIAGKDPFLVCMLGAFIITPISLYMAHGFTKKTTIALFSMLLTISLSIGMAVLFVDLTQLSGNGSEDASMLKIGLLQNLNLRGLLLGGIIFGTIGILDDITTAQTAAVHEILKANPKLTFKELYHRGSAVGREHIASLVNTLVLAYVGSSFPVLILFSINTGVPLFINLNSEFITEEIVRTLVGSITLLLAVPLSTLLAAHLLNRSWGKFEKIFDKEHGNQEAAHIH